MLRILAALFISLLVLMAVRADADDPPQPSASGRYTLHQVDGGYLRLDTANGRVSFCHRKQDNWVCELLAEDRLAFEKEIAGLAAENRALREENAALKQSAEDGEETGTIELPNRRDVDRFMAFFDQMIRRFFDMVQSLKEESERERTEGSEPGPWFPPAGGNETL